jgi:hypothetical protein
MVINISSEIKKRLAGTKYAIPNKLLIKQSEVEARENNQLNDEQLIQIFDRIWTDRLKTAIEDADKCDEKSVRNKLSERAASFIDSSQEHREFRLQPEGLSFIVQLRPIDDRQHELTQLWFIPSTDSSPQCLYICFKDMQEKENFKEMANSLHYADPSELALKLIRDFMSTLQKKS